MDKFSGVEAIELEKKLDHLCTGLEYIDVGTDGNVCLDGTWSIEQIIEMAEILKVRGGYMGDEYNGGRDFELEKKLIKYTSDDDYIRVFKNGYVFLDGEWLVEELTQVVEILKGSNTK